MLSSIFSDFERDALAPLEQDILRGEQAKAALALNAQRRLEEAQSRIEHASVEGLGQLEARVHPEVYFRMVHLHGQGCWGDPGFLKSMRQKNPGMFSVPRGSRATTLRVDGLKPETGNRKPDSSENAPPGNSIRYPVSGIRNPNP